MEKQLQMKYYSKLSPKRGWSWETPPAPIPENQIVETLEDEVLVIGGGISGLAAAARCVDKGLGCVVIDKNDRLVALAGQIAAVNSAVMADKGIVIDKKQLAADWLKVSGSRVQEELLWIFINRSAEGFDWMMALGEGSLEVGVYVGYKGPMFSEYPGTHHVFQKKGSTRYDNIGGGMLACEIFEKEFLNKGGRLFRSTAAVQLQKNESGRVVSCVATGPDGKYRRYKGSRAVILATGDCSDDKEMLEAFCPIGLRPSKQFPRHGNTGDGQKMAYWAGAVLDNAEWAPTLHALGYSGFQGFFLHVNQLGRRFMNEDTWMQAKSVRCLMQPGGDFAFSIFDDKVFDEVGERWNIIGGQGMAPLSVVGEAYDRGMMEREIERAVTAGNGFKAESLEELARLIDVPAGALCKTVARYNEIVAGGDDTDFGKRSELLTSVVKPPFYALKWGPSLLDVFGGAMTDDRLNVLGTDGQPIPGLYAVGNAAGGMYAVDYPLLLNGNSYGRALAYAVQVADSLLEQSN
jgi:succinate dehydrogenase/fumarate reductase flavoprotein subunit